LVKGTFVPRLDLRHLQIWPHSETVSRPYASSGLNKTCPHHQNKFTLINPKLVVKMIRFLPLLLKYALGCFDIFIFEAMVLCDV